MSDTANRLEVLKQQRDALNARVHAIEDIQSLEPRVSAVIRGQGGLAVTHSEAGVPRVRAYVLDDDAGLGYIEQSVFCGLALSSREPDTYVLESHYPHALEKPTYFWRFTPVTGALALKHMTRAVDDEGFDLYVDPGDRAKYFTTQLRNVLEANNWDDLEGPLAGDRINKYSFKLPELA